MQKPALSGNALKLIAAVTMLIDHAGLLLFPGALWMRIVGRLAFPIYAFMIAEGCRYTRNRARYLGLIAALAAAYQVVYFLFNRSLYMSILVTFSLAILTVYALQAFKSTLIRRTSPTERVCAGLVLVSAVVFVWLFTRVFTVDYGFYGCMVPVAASVFMPRRGEEPGWLARFDSQGLHVLMLSLALIVQAQGNLLQLGALMACPLLLLYSGRRGKLALKYFFYIFYPVHLVALQGIAMLIR